MKAAKRSGVKRRVVMLVAARSMRSVMARLRQLSQLARCGWRVLARWQCQGEARAVEGLRQDGAARA